MRVYSMLYTDRVRGTASQWLNYRNRSLNQGCTMPRGVQCPGVYNAQGCTMPRGVQCPGVYNAQGCTMPRGVQCPGVYNAQGCTMPRGSEGAGSQRTKLTPKKPTTIGLGAPHCSLSMSPRGSCYTCAQIGRCKINTPSSLSLTKTNNLLSKMDQVCARDTLSLKWL